MLAAGSVQEAHDFALVAHAATLRARVPFLHFFDGFRTSHEINKIAVLEEDDLRALVRDDDVLAFRGRGMTPDAPVVRGAPPRTPMSSSRRARHRTRSTWLSPASSKRSWTSCRTDRPPVRAGRLPRRARRGPRDRGDGLAAGAVEETVDTLVAAGERLGCYVSACSSRFPPIDHGRAAADGARHRGARPDERAGRCRRAALPGGRRGPGRSDGPR